mmetsp:Transcript_29907/g.45880  ORF Transcript_29907/g.45880 Transcript_29907/m.45880 type:complete len:166 (-) Transcript_29907:1595-2092(-)
MQDQNILENTSLRPDFESNSSFPIKALMSVGGRDTRLSSDEGDFPERRRRVRFACPLTVDLVADAEARKEVTNFDQTCCNNVEEREFRKWLFELDPDNFSKPELLYSFKDHDKMPWSKPGVLKVIREDVTKEKLKEYQSRRKAVARGFERLEQRFLSNFAGPGTS